MKKSLNILSENEKSDNPSHVVKSGIWRKWKCLHFCGHVFFCPSQEGTVFSPVNQLLFPDVWKWPTTWHFSLIWWVIMTRILLLCKWRWVVFKLYRKIIYSPFWNKLYVWLFLKHSKGFLHIVYKSYFK